MDTTPTHGRPRRLLIPLAAIAVVAGLGFSGVASAAGEDDTSGERPAATARVSNEERCEKAEAILARADALLAKIADFEARLAELKEKAIEAGREELVERIDQWLARLAALTDKIETRVARVEAWVGEHCD